MVLFEEKSGSDMEVRTPSASVAVGRKRVEESELRDPPHVVLCIRPFNSPNKQTVSDPT